MSLKAAILGFLELEPTSGYTLQKRFDGSVRGFWTATQSQIYRELHALEQAGLVTQRVEHNEGKPARKMYANTRKGRAELERWLKEPLEPLQLRHPLLLKLVFSADLAPAVLDQLLARYEEGLRAQREDYAQRIDAEEIFSLARSEREAELWRLSIEHGQSWVDAELAWLNRARRRLTRTEPKPARTTPKRQR